MLVITMSIPKSKHDHLPSSDMVRRNRPIYLKPNEQFAS